MASSSKALRAGVLAFLALYAFVGLFGFVSPYDDEGYNVAMIKLVSQGVPLYTSQFAYHGPVPYWIKALTLHALGVPVTHQSIRIWVLGVWLLSSWLLGASIGRLSSWRLAGVAGCLVVGTHLFPLRFNPGHPEDFVVLGLAIAIWLASVDAPWMKEPLRAASLGVVGAVLIGTKINVGVLYWLGLGAWMLASLRGRRSRTIAGWLFVAAATATPAILMHRFLIQEWQLLLFATLSIFFATSAFLVFEFPQAYGSREVACCAASAIFGLALIAGVAALLGSHPGDLVNGVVLTAAKHSSIFLRPLSFGFLTVYLVGISLLACAFALSRFRLPAELLGQPSPWVKTILALLALALASFGVSSVYVALVGPICWLVAFPREAVPIVQRRARLLVACLAAFQMLQMFPITGAQNAWSTLPLCICAVLLAIDGITELRQENTRIPWAAKALANAVAILALALPLLSTLELGNAYFRMPGIELPGSTLIRVPLDTKADLDYIVATVDQHCNALITQPGLNSLLLWSKLPLRGRNASPVLISGWPLILSDEQERAEIAKLSDRSGVCAVYNKTASDWWTNDGPELTPAGLSRQPLVAYIRQLQPVRKVGDYEIRALPAAVANWGDDYLLHGERTIEGGRNSIAVPAELLAPGMSAELRFAFQAYGSGPLLSVRPPDVSAPTSALSYIGPKGQLMIAAGNGKYAPTRIANELDGRWHEVLLRRQGKTGWEVSIDGANMSRIPGSAEFSALEPGVVQIGAAVPDDGLKVGIAHSFRGRLRDVRLHWPQISSLPTHPQALTSLIPASHQAE